MLYFSMVSKAAIARVSVEIVFGFEDIKSLLAKQNSDYIYIVYFILDICSYYNLC